MKSFMYTLTLVILLTLFTVTSFQKATYVHAWEDCPFGLENDPYPGQCGRYVDTDGNGICDHSEAPPEQRTNSASSEVDTTENPQFDSQTEVPTSTSSGEAIQEKPTTKKPAQTAIINVYKKGSDKNNMPAIVLLSSPIFLGGVYIFVRKYLLHG